MVADIDENVRGNAVRRTLTLVVNPMAGGGRSGRLLPRVEQALRAAGHDVLVAPTRSLSHGEQLAEEAAGAGRLVVAMGGDGLVGRVAGAVASAGGLLAVLPAGRGNDFARAVGISRDPVRACAVLVSGRERAVDMGVVRSGTGECAFLGIASVGVDSDAQELLARNGGRLGRLGYLYAALRAVATFAPATFTATVDGRPVTVTGWSFAVANDGVYGGGMRLAPAASVEDGRLDVVTIGRLSRASFLALLPTVFVGAHVRHPAVEVCPAEVVDLAADRPFRVFADGDPAGTLPCTVLVRPAALRILLPVSDRLTRHSRRRSSPGGHGWDLD